jgi:hypothetical protein
MRAGTAAVGGEPLWGKLSGGRRPPAGVQGGNPSTRFRRRRLMKPRLFRSDTGLTSGTGNPGSIVCGEPKVGPDANRGERPCCSSASTS